MKTEVDREQLHILRFRKERLANRLRELEGRVSGMQGSILPMVRDEAGNFSEERAQALIDAFLEAYRDFLLLDGRREEHVALPEGEALYRSFLYCAIRYVECPPLWDSDFYELPAARGTYGDILWLAQGPMPADRAELLFWEFYRPWELKGFFACMDELYHKLSPDTIVQDFEEGDYLLMRETYRQEIQELEQVGQDQEALKDMMGEDAWQETLRQHFEGIEEGIAELEEDALAREEEALREQRMQEEWRAHFREQEAFCRQYLLFRKAYFEAPSRRRIAGDIACMLDMALLRQGTSHYMDNDFYFYAFAVLEKAAGLLERLPADRR